MFLKENYTIHMFEDPLFPFMKIRPNERDFEEPLQLNSLESYKPSQALGEVQEPCKE
jgi:hypothetical protein